MTHDLVIRGGTIVDGTGRAGYAGDVAIDGDRIVQIGEVSGEAFQAAVGVTHPVTPAPRSVRSRCSAERAC